MGTKARINHNKNIVTMARKKIEIVGNYETISLYENPEH